MIFKNFNKMIKRFCKFIGLIFYYLTGWHRRNNSKWVISSKKNFSDNSKYLYLLYKDYLFDEYGVELIWVTSGKDTYKYLLERGFNVSYTYSLKGIKDLFLAKIYIGSYGLDQDFLWYFSRGAEYVELWHGIPLKKIYGSDENWGGHKIIESKLLSLINPFYLRETSLFLSTSLITTEIFNKSFKVRDKNFFVSSYPRCHIFEMNDNEIIDWLKKNGEGDLVDLIDNLKKYKNVFIYMPTWRDADKNFINNKNIFKWHEIDEVLKQDNSVLLVKAHPMSNEIEDIEYSNILKIEKEKDVYPILKYTDCLITDFSSIYFDYLRMKNKKVALFIFDADFYMNNCRGLLFDYDKVFHGEKLNTFNDLKNFIKNYNEFVFDDSKMSLSYKFDYYGVDNFKLFLEEIKKISNNGIIS